MTQHLPVAIVIIPLMLSIVNAFLGQRHPNAAFIMTIAAMAGCLAGSILILNMVTVHGTIHYRLGGWAPPIGIVYRIDHLNAFMLILIAFIGLIAAVHAKKSIEREMPDKVSLFWSLFLLLITGLFGIVATGDLFNLFVFLEVASLTGYALIAAGNKKAAVAGIRYLILGSIGASFYLLGVGYLYIATGTLNMEDVNTLLPGLFHSTTVRLGCAFILLGIGIKTALFPLHAWLPDAYTFAPSAVCAVVAPLMTKVMAYVLIRVLFTVFGAPFSIAGLNVTGLMVWMGTFAILFGAVMALSQTNFRRMLSYIIVAEIGYIVGGIGIANATALKGALFHIVNDAVMMACMFLIAGQIHYQKGGHHIDDFTGIFRTMPWTAAVFAVGALAIIGVPPTCGFFSKWYLLLGGIQAGQWGFVAALLICTGINIALFFTIFDKTFLLHAQPLPDQTALAAPVAEAPLSMMIPAVVVASVIILLGVFNQFIINHVLNFTVF